MRKAEWHCLVEVVFKHYSVGAQFCPYFHAQVLLVSNIFRWRSTWTDQGAHREGCWFCICLAVPKNQGILALFHKEGVLCIICTVQCPDAIRWVTSSSRNVVSTATARSASAQPSTPVLLAFFTVLCFVPCFAGFAQECGWFVRWGAPRNCITASPPNSWLSVLLVLPKSHFLPGHLKKKILLFGGFETCE